MTGSDVIKELGIDNGHKIAMTCKSVAMVTRKSVTMVAW